MLRSFQDCQLTSQESHRIGYQVGFYGQMLVAQFRGGLGLVREAIAVPVMLPLASAPTITQAKRSV